MAKLISEDLELDFTFLEYHDYQPKEFDFKVTLKWKGIPLLNEKAMKRYAGQDIGTKELKAESLLKKWIILH